MNGNLFVTEAKNGRRSNGWRLIITTGSKRKRHASWGSGTEPEFAIGQRALFLQSDGGNLFWDCITLLDGQTAAELNARGAIRAIAISHPHYYTTMVDWAERFDAQIFFTGDIIQVVQDRRYVRFMRSYQNLIPLGAGRDPTYSRKDRTILIRTKLRRVVESERSLRCQSGGAPFSRTVPPR